MSDIRKLPDALPVDGRRLARQGPGRHNSLSERKAGRRMNSKLKLGAVCVAVGVAAALPAGCGSSSGTSLTNASAGTKSCWNVAAHKLAVIQAHKYLGPLDNPHSKLYEPGAGREMERLDAGANMLVARQWTSSAKSVHIPPLSTHYYGPSRAWLRATKARCGSLN